MTNYVYNLAALKEGDVVQDGRTVLQVSTIYTHHATLQVVYPKPKRTTVRSYTNDQIVRGTLKYASDHMYDKAFAKGNGS